MLALIADFAENPFLLKLQNGVCWKYHWRPHVCASAVNCICWMTNFPAASSSKESGKQSLKLIVFPVLSRIFFFFFFQYTLRYSLVRLGRTTTRDTQGKMATQNDVAAQLTIGSTDKSVRWYDKSFAGVQPDARILLETYSRIPAEKVNEHVLEIVRTYPLLPTNFHPLHLELIAISLARQSLGCIPLPLYRPIPLPQPQPEQANVLSCHAGPHQGWCQVSGYWMLRGPRYSAARS